MPILESIFFIKSAEVCGKAFKVSRSSGVLSKENLATATSIVVAAGHAASAHKTRLVSSLAASACSSNSVHSDGKSKEISKAFEQASIEELRGCKGHSIVCSEEPQFPLPPSTSTSELWHDPKECCQDVQEYRCTDVRKVLRAIILETPWEWRPAAFLVFVVALLVVFLWKCFGSRSKHRSQFDLRFHSGRQLLND